jgi:ribosome maturation factor RimP
MSIADRVRETAQPLARAEGVELLDVTFAREGRTHVLRLVIEREAGPTSVRDCEAVSRAVEAALDATDLIPHRYLLEVTSAGADRPLRGPADFRRHAGRPVRVALRGGRAGPLAGTLIEADEASFEIELRDGSHRRIAYADVAEVRRDVSLGRPAS